jgi:hypothetical protein
MMEITPQRFKPVLPMKSVAGALLFSVLLGPVGLLYSSLAGGIILIVLCFTALCGKFYGAASIFWLLSCIVSVAAVNHYNKKIFKMLSSF